MDILFTVYFFIFGTMVGSFLNVVILRLPKKEDLVLARSGCRSCGNQLKWYHNIPVASFLVLRGKCAFCSHRISWRYPLIEILTGLVALWLMPASFDSYSIAIFLFKFLIACIFIAHFFIDLDHHLLLDSLNLYLLAVILAYSLFHYHWLHSLFGGLLGFGAPLLVTWLFYKIRGQVGLGGGDIKLYGILGILFGPMGIVFTIFLSCFVGAIVGLGLIALGKSSRDKPMAFGPAIILVAAFQIYFPSYAQLLQSWLF
jgi:prepilin signal peptidase PulO-like enzyme (type II secretory pathway)